MAKGTFVGIGKYVRHTKRKRSGVHSKTKQSSNKHSKLYVKQYRGQGK